MSILREKLHDPSFPARKYFDETTTINTIGFRFREKSNPSRYVSHLTEIMSKPYPRNRLLCAGSIAVLWDLQEVINLLDILQPETARLMLMAQNEWDTPMPTGTDGTASPAPLRPSSEWLKEPIYGTEYRLVPISNRLLQSIRNPSPIDELALPGENEFVPSRFDVDKVEIEVSIHDNSG